MDIVSLPSLLAIPNSFGAPPSSLQPGEIIDATVVALLDNGLARLQVPDGTIDVRTAVPLTVGAKVRLAVNGTSAGLQLVVLADAGAGRPAVPAALVARQPADGRASAAPAAGNPFATPAVEIAVQGSAAAVPPAASPPLSADALAEAVQAAAARQGGLAPLLADLEQAANGGALSASVAAAAARVLDLRVPLDGLDPAALRQALARSGLFLEAGLAATLASGTAGAAGAMDLKAALLVLRQMAKAWFDVEGAPAPTAMAAPANAPPPPYRGAPPSAQPAVPPSLAPYAPAGATAARLLAETDAALARQTLLQVASLPAPVTGSLSAAQRGGHWAFEIPFATGAGSAIAQFEISRDGRAAAPDGRSMWRVRFSLNVEPMGPVHALIAVTGERAAVTLWAEREASAARLRAQGGLLAEALRAAALTPGDIQFRVGAPAAPPPAAGRFLDRAS
ncbi:MAG TPA: flagellar hook-length control protein FliK [Xanthobacteraceae bacterium]|nr:flagellar hook-length control protein FliK [Xanthobacteraceae bacterium]